MSDKQIQTEQSQIRVSMSVLPYEYDQYWVTIHSVDFSSEPVVVCSQQDLTELSGKLIYADVHTNEFGRHIKFPKSFVECLVPPPPGVFNNLCGAFNQAQFDAFMDQMEAIEEDPLRFVVWTTLQCSGLAAALVDPILKKPLNAFFHEDLESSALEKLLDVDVQESVEWVAEYVANCSTAIVSFSRKRNTSPAEMANSLSNALQDLCLRDPDLFANLKSYLATKYGFIVANDFSISSNNKSIQ